jgi:hypothetical protein
MKWATITPRGGRSSARRTFRRHGRPSERGELILGGALANPVDGAVLLFRGDSPEVAEKFARADPYVIHGAVKHWRVREWTAVVGAAAAFPVRH